LTKTPEFPEKFPGISGMSGNPRKKFPEISGNSVRGIFGKFSGFSRIYVSLELPRRFGGVHKT
jgi:hypothetical protein